MKKINLTIDIKKDEFKKKLGIKDGVDGEKGDKGDKGEQGSPDTAYQIIDKLESIDNESEKLSIEAIKDLRKELDRIEKKIGVRPIFGGGFSKLAMDGHIIDDQTPTGTVNGINTVFNISQIPSPTNSLKVYINGQRQRISVNYTLSGTAITFTDAPLSGDVILCDFRI